MAEDTDQIGIGFFGSTMASISHELKNRIAIIKEHAGLLKDYSAMAAEGREVSTDRLGRLGVALGEQVAMADHTLKNMNQLAHSVDDVLRPADLDDLLRLTTALAERGARLHRVDLTWRPSGSCITVRTCQFLLINLFSLCLSALVRSLNGPGGIELGPAESAGGSVSIGMRLDGPEKAAVGPLIPEGLGPLSQALAADVEWEDAEKVLLVRLPVDVTGSDRVGDLLMMFEHLRCGGNLPWGDRCDESIPRGR